MASAASTTPDAEDQRSGWRPAVRDELGYLAEIAGLAGFAIAQPILSPFGESPETFLAVGATSGQIVRFALAVAFVPPLVIWVVAMVTRVGGERVRLAAQAVVVGFLAGAAASLLARSLDAGSAVRTVAALVVGVGIGVLRDRGATAVRLFLRYTAPVPAILAALFLFASPVAPLVRPPSAEVREASASSASDLPPVVFVVLDELPTASILDGSGAVEGDLFPNLARVADTSTWYRNHTTGAAATLQSLPVMLTGRYPDDAAAKEFPIYANYPDNLFTALGSTYDLRVSENSTKLCPTELCPTQADEELDEDVADLTVAPTETPTDPVGSLLDEARALWRDEAWPLSDGFEAGYTLGVGGAEAKAEVISQAQQAVNRIRPAGTDDRPVLDYFHFALPHQPWFMLPDGRTHDAPEIPFGNEFVRFWPDGQVGTDLGQAGESRMQLQLQWADRALGTAIDRLQDLGRWDDALVVVTADHGISFEPGTSARVADESNQRSLAWAPLFIKLPGQTEAKVVDDPVMSIDVVPTILDVLGIDATWDVEGVSLLDGPPPADRDRPFVLAVDTDFDTMLRDRIGVLDADGFTPLLTAGRDVEPGDELGVWRYGRRGDLIGESVDDLGVCDGTGPAIDVPVSEGWTDLTAGRLAADDPLPLWHEGTVAGSESIDVVGVVDGRVVGWSPTLPTAYADSRVGMLFAEPLVLDAASDPTYYEVVGGADCTLRPLAGQ
ncbi:MAG: sulfatase-like hydrolase/transferase [Actinobacteria bacterium]|nr:sulfatase-like hydrolase/transferase [Actinomycetota bacterium]